MSVRPYTPKTELLSSSVGIVLFNHVGSCVLGDTGRDAQHMADTTGLLVIAADRPGSGFTHPGQNRRLAGDYIGAVSRLAGRRIMPEVEAARLQHVVIAGRSAGGLAALTAVCTEQLPAVAVNAQEAVGWSQLTVEQGRQTYNSYLAQQRAMIADPEHELVRPEPTDQTGWRWWVRAGAIISTGLVDRTNNKDVWSQDIALTSAFTVAARHPQVRADIVFAEHSMVASPTDVACLQRQLPIARSIHRDSAPINVWVEPNTIHSSFDLRELSARLVGATAASVLPSPTN